jgi:hypothetical protein
MKKLNKKLSEINEIKSSLDESSNDNKKQTSWYDEYEQECKNKCRKLNNDKKRKMVGFDFEYIYDKCDKLNEYIQKNNGQCSIGNYTLTVGGLHDSEIKCKDLYVQDKIRLILEEIKTKPIEFFESYVNGVKHLKQEYKIHKNSQILMHDDDDEIANQALDNL